MKVLITGSSGDLARTIISKLKSSKIDYVEYSHSSKLSDLNWENIDTVINCAAKIPSENVKVVDFYQANVLFLQELLSFSIGKNFLHFSTFSELYKNDHYQKSKMLANSLLLTNSHLLNKLNILSLPTLDDEVLINGIVSSIKKGEAPVVDELFYNYMSYDLVAESVLEGLQSGGTYSIAEAYIEKNLYSEVCKRVGSATVIKGQFLDRSLKSNNLFTVCPNLLNSIMS